MHTRYRNILLALCLLLSHSLWAQGGKSATLTLTAPQEEAWHVTFQLGEMRLDSVDDRCVAVHAEGMVSLAPQAGLPSLPQMSRLLMLPRGSRVELNGKETSCSEIQRLAINGLVQPYSGATVKGLPAPEAEPDGIVYGSKEAYRATDPVTIEDLGTMGGQQLFRLTVHPVAYRPADGILELTSTITATLTITHSPLDTPHSPLPERLLIVSRPQFRDGLQPFVKWKRQEGYEVVEIYADTNKRNIIKALISPLFASSEAHWPHYLLLVGDAAQIQSCPGTTHPSGLDNHITDLYYAEHTGDYLPDAIIGRWPVNDTAQLNAVVRKTLQYEQCLDMNLEHLQRALLVAGSESQNPAPITTNGQVNYVARELKLAHPGMDTLCYHNPASSSQTGTIMHDLEQGATWLNYTGHCTTAGWTSPSVSFGTIDTLDNPQPLLFINNCCLSNAFTGTCFGEQLLRKPSGGAVGVIGATNSTLWNEDYYWSVGPKYPFSLNPEYNPDRLGAFDRWTGRVGDVQTPGELLMAGNLSVTASGSPYDKFYWEAYCLLGDPSLMPWVGTPLPITLLTTDGAPHNGDGSVNISGTVGVAVTAIQHDSLLGVGTVGADGRLSLRLNCSLDTTPLLITATAYGHRPHTDTLTVLPVDGAGAALHEVTFTDSTVSCRVENVGSLPLFGLHIMLSPLNSGASLEEQQTAIDTLLPQQSRFVTLPLQISIGQAQWWQAQLSAQDSTHGLLSTITLQQPLQTSPINITFRLMDGDSNDAPKLLPQRNYLLETTTEGTCDSLGITVTALPTFDTLASTHSLLPITLLSLTTPDTLTHLHIEANLHTAGNTTHHSHYIVAGDRMDSFEEGFSSHPWQLGGSQPWIIDTTYGHRGHRSARSGTIEYRQTSVMELELILLHPDTISYWVKVSSQNNHDKFQFFVDGNLKGTELSGEVGWTRRAHALEAGHHLLRWRYVKNESIDAGNDCVWIDDVQMPMALWDSAYGWFGDTTTLSIQGVITHQPSFNVYPNPTTGTVTLDGVPEGTLHILDIYGREICSQHITYATPHTIHLDFLPDGVYLLQFIGAQVTGNHKLIIRH